MNSKSKIFLWTKNDLVIYVLFFSIVFANTFFIENKYNETFVLILILFLVGLLLISLKFNLYILLSLIIASIPLEQFLNLYFFFFTLTDLLIIVFIFNFIYNKRTLIFNNYIILIAFLIIVCGISILLSEERYRLLSIYIRLLSLFVFLTCTNSLDLDRTSASILKGFTLLPLALIVNIAGAGVLLKFLTFNLGDFDLVIGSHKYVAWFAFFFPIIARFKIKKIFKTLFFIYFILLVYFSFSRSLLLSTTFAILIYFLTTYKVSRFKTVLLLSIFIPIVFIGSAYLEFFSFSTEAGTYKEVSNLQRYSKVTNSINAFIEKPYFGHGFGMSQIENKVSTASTNEEALELASVTRFSPEIMPIQILAEVGVIGFFSFIIIFSFFFKDIFYCLKIKNLNVDIKVVLILISGINLMYFINSNSFSNSFFYIFLLIPFLIKKSFLNFYNEAVQTN